MARPSFETMVLQARGHDRKRYGEALAARRGPAPGAAMRPEKDLDDMWGHTALAYRHDPPEAAEAFRAAYRAQLDAGLKDFQAAPIAAAQTLQQYPQAAFPRLMLPREQGGGGLTPLAASLEKYPYRRVIYEGGGAEIADKIKVADKRKARFGAPAPVEEAAPVPAPMAAPPAEPKIGGY